jgi:hypothetical protein
MPRNRLIALCLGLATVCAHGQQPASTSSDAPQVNARPERVKVYSVGPGIEAPRLLPLNLTPITVEKCKEKIDGKVELSLLVDTSGHARNITFLRPVGTELDRIALGIADANQLSAGTLNGKPVVVAESLRVTIQTCRVKTKESAGAKNL